MRICASLLLLATVAACVAAPVPAAADQPPEPLLRWVFDAECQQKGGFVDRQRGLVAKPVARPRILAAGELQALALDGLTDHLVVAADYAAAGLPWPQRELTITAWVLVDRPEKWGGIFSLIQDNGGAEQEELAPFRPWFIDTVRRSYHFAYVTICGRRCNTRPATIRAGCSTTSGCGSRTPGGGAMGRRQDAAEDAERTPRTPSP